MKDKSFSLIRPFVNRTHNKNPKSCTICDQRATEEIVYSVGEDLSVAECYCNKCAIVIVQQGKESP